MSLANGPEHGSYVVSDNSFYGMSVILPDGDRLSTPVEVEEFYYKLQQYSEQRVRRVKGVLSVLDSGVAIQSHPFTRIATVVYPETIDSRTGKPTEIAVFEDCDLFFVGADRERYVGPNMQFGDIGVKRYIVASAPVASVVVDVARFEGDASSDTELIRNGLQRLRDRELNYYPDIDGYFLGSNGR